LGLELGIVSVTFRTFTPQQVVEIAEEHRLSAIEWAADVHVQPGDRHTASTLKVRCESAGIRNVSYASYFRGGVHPDSDLDALRATAVLLGAANIRIWAGDIGSLECEPRQRRAITQGIKSAARLANRDGLTISLEFHANTLTDSLESTQRLIEDVDEDNLSTYWQPRPGVTGQVALREVASLLGDISSLHICVRDVRNRRRPLVDGQSIWRRILPIIVEDEIGHHGLFEFVVDDRPAQLKEDIETFRSWLRN
jgi:3-dehydroshikimate dehydratase